MSKINFGFTQYRWQAVVSPEVDPFLWRVTQRCSIEILQPATKTFTLSAT
jgi:hypothetical protein